MYLSVVLTESEIKENQGNCYWQMIYGDLSYWQNKNFILIFVKKTEFKGLCNQKPLIETVSPLKLKPIKRHKLWS